MITILFNCEDFFFLIKFQKHRYIHPNIETFLFYNFQKKISYNSSLIVQFVKYLNTPLQLQCQ